MEWLMARDEKGQPKTAPAVVVVHESGRGMQAGRMIARALRNMGVHTFLIHLPGYGARASAFTRDMRNMLPGMAQAVADVRRARDAVVTLPFVDSSLISVQGTSLGGFVVATVVGLDRGYDQAVILLAGGRIADVLLTGKRDAQKMHQRLTEVGVTDEQIREMTKTIEPLRLAHRVNPVSTWLFSGKFDDVVPPACTEAFAKAAKLGVSNHYILPVGHYSAVLVMPAILPRMIEIVRRKGK
jgi:dienelactone hydrolase